MTYEAASRLAETIHHEHVPCQVVAEGGHSFIVAITLPEHPELYVFSSQEWQEMRTRVAP
jgi:hypothetical protein